MIRRIVRVGIQILFFTVRIDLYLQLQLQVLTVHLNLIAPVATNRAPVEHEGGLVLFVWAKQNYDRY